MVLSFWSCVFFSFGCDLFPHIQYEPSMVNEIHESISSIKGSSGQIIQLLGYPPNPINNGLTIETHQPYIVTNHSLLWTIFYKGVYLVEFSERALYSEDVVY